MSDPVTEQKATELDLKLIYTDTLRGYSSYKSQCLKLEKIYIKHLGIFDTVNTDEVYNKSFETAKASKLPTDDEQKVYLEKQDLWSEKEDLEIARLSSYVSNLKQTKSKLFLKSQIDPIKKDIEENENLLQKLSIKKRELLGLTAEAYAAKKTNESYIKQAIFQDAEFKTHALPEEKFNELSDADLTGITIEYNIATRFLNLDTLKKISILPFFCNYYYLSDDNPQIFYGKPIVDLTYFQVELFAYARFFKQMAQDAKAKPPEDIINDPDKLLEFYESRKNAEEFMEKNSGQSKNPDGAGGTSIVGATKEDLEAVGISNPSNSVDLVDIAASKGGELSMQDFIDLHG